MQDLNPQQKKAAEAAVGPLIIVAGAGTGKTRTLTHRIIHLINEGVPPERVCAITFTNKAAEEMRSRISLSTNNESIANKRIRKFETNLLFADLPFIGTFHSLGAKILRKEARALGRAPNFVIFDSDDSFSLIKRIVKKFFPKEDHKKVLRQAQDKKSPAYFARKIGEIKNLYNADGDDYRLSERSESKANHLKTLRQAQGINCVKIYNEYENELKKNNAFDFDDLIEKPVSLFEKHPEILEKYQKKFDAILVDEYQDVNPKQYDFVRLLSGGHRNLSVVGDDEQMIYGWRYADVKIFLNFDRDWPGAQIAFLEENYRSTANIINAAAAVAKNNLLRTPKTLWTKSEAGAPIKIIEIADEEQEAEYIARAIYNADDADGNNADDADNHTQHPHKTFVDPHYESIAVLYRTNAQSRALEQALIRHQIPYKIFGGVRFYERKEIKDIIAALRWVFNPKDTISRERLEKNLPKFKFRALEDALIETKNELAAPKTNGGGGLPTELIKTFLEATDYLEYLDRSYLNAEERRENIKELVGFAAGFDDLERFLEEVALVQPLDQSGDNNKNRGIIQKNQENHSGHSDVFVDSDRGRWPEVHLMTIHLAKGLEFDRVFIAGCSEGLMPHAMSMDKSEQLEEERRLMYVAMTRAKKELNISFYNIPSRFIGEIPQELAEYKTAADNAAGNEEEEIVFLD